MKKLFAYLNIVLCISAVLSVNPAMISADNEKEMRGKPFSDPLKSSEMPKEWQKQGIRYVPDFINADLVVDLNQQLDQILEPYVKGFAKANNLKIITTKGTCGKSAAKVDRKEVDIGGFCCPPGEHDRLPGLKYHTLGITPLAFLVHPDNTVKDISLTQLRQILKGDITDWSEVGGRDMPIKKIVSFHCKHRPGHWTLALKHEDLFSPDVLTTGEMEDMIAFVASNPGAIGFETMHVAARFRHRGEVNALKIDGYAPEPENLRTLDYSIYRTFNVTSWEGDNTRNPHAQKLVEYLMENADQIAGKAGILPYSILRKSGWNFHEDELIGEPEQ